MIRALLTTTLLLAVVQQPPQNGDQSPPPAEQNETPDVDQEAVPEPDPESDTPPPAAKEAGSEAPGDDARAVFDAARALEEESKAAEAADLKAADPNAADPKAAKAKAGEASDAEAKPAEVPPEAKIEQNYREAMRTYQGVFSQESSMDLQNVRTRIAANEKLLADHNARLTEAEGRLRALRTGFDRKVMAARQSQKDGKIPQATFDRLLSEQKEQKASQERELEGDIAFYRQEAAAARTRLVDLRSRNRLLSFDADLNGGQKAARAAPSLQDEILAKFQKLNRFELRPIPLPYHDARGGCGECRDCVLGNNKK